MPVKTTLRRTKELLVLGMAAWAVLPAGCQRLATSPATPAEQAERAAHLYVDGAMAYQEGDRERAMAALQNALQDNPDLIMARFLLAGLYRDKGEFDAAAENYKKVVELDPYSYTNHYNLGLMYHLLAKLQEAAASYLEAIRLNPVDPKSNMNLGLVYTALGKPDQGLPYAQKAVEVEPRSADAQANLAVVLDSLSLFPEAERHYRTALELDSSRLETVINLAGNLVSQKRYKDAIAIYEQVLRTRDNSMVRQRLGHALLAAGRIDEAVREFEAALKQAPGNYQARNGLGDAMIQQYRAGAMLDEKKRSAAVAHWKASLEINPDQPRVQAMLREYTDKSLFP
ncbi:MAG: tetratricopeptide repeat protein [Tepidisphaeraceae bacterium]|jgi:tetratricopeptide (TPR) repeat protein